MTKREPIKVCVHLIIIKKPGLKEEVKYGEVFNSIGEAERAYDINLKKKKNNTWKSGTDFFEGVSWWYMAHKAEISCKRVGWNGKLSTVRK